MSILSVFRIILIRLYYQNDTIRANILSSPLLPHDIHRPVGRFVVDILDVERDDPVTWTP